MEESDQPDVFMESFVDVLSCGLGAALLLFLIFSTMPRDGAQRPQEGAAAEDAPLVDGDVQRRPPIGQIVAQVSATAGFRLVVDEPRPPECQVSDRTLQCFHAEGRLPACVLLRLSGQADIDGMVEVQVSRMASGRIDHIRPEPLRPAQLPQTIAIRPFEPEAWVRLGEGCP